MQWFMSVVALLGLIWAIISWPLERRDRKAAESQVMALRGRFERWAITEKRAFRLDQRWPTATPGSDNVEQLRFVYEPANVCVFVGPAGTGEWPYGGCREHGGTIVIPEASEMCNGERSGPHLVHAWSTYPHDSG
jgi:hypothetical protein